MPCDLTYEECASSAHPCFGHKMSYWRQDGVPGIALPDHADWTGPTVRERARDTVERAKQNGYDPVYQGRATLI